MCCWRKQEGLESRQSEMNEPQIFWGLKVVDDGSALVSFLDSLTIPTTIGFIVYHTSERITSPTS
jgi:hypothetical protein